MKYGVVIMPSGIVCYDTDYNRINTKAEIIASSIELAQDRASRWNANEEARALENYRQVNNYAVFEWTREVCKRARTQGHTFRYTGKTL